MAAQYPPAPRYLVPTNGVLPPGIDVVPLLQALFQRLNIYYAFEGSGFKVEMWSPSGGDFARAKVQFYTRVEDGVNVYEVTIETGSSALLMRLFAAIRDVFAGGLDAAPATLTRVRAAAAPARAVVPMAEFVATLATIVTHLDRTDAPNLVLHAAQYFNNLATENPTYALYMSLHEPLIAALFEVLEPARRLPIETVTTAVATLGQITKVAPVVPSLHQHQLMAYWNSLTAGAVELDKQHLRKLLAAFQAHGVSGAAGGGGAMGVPGGRRRRSKPRKSRSKSSRKSRR